MNSVLNLEAVCLAYRDMFGVIGTMQALGIKYLLGRIQADPLVMTVEQASYMLATVYHETAHTFQPIEEYGKREYFNKYEPGTAIGRTLGNKNPGDGYLYRGRGYSMVTGLGNYGKFQELLKIPMVLQPELALEPEHAYSILSLGMLRGKFTGASMLRYVPVVGTINYFMARKSVNGIDRAQDIAHVAEVFVTILRRANVGQVQIAGQTKGEEVEGGPAEPSKGLPVEGKTDA
jgi:putative chitinase